MERLAGLSNMVFLVTTHHQVSPNPIIFRKFSTKEGIIDRDKEARVFLAMAQKGIGPQCYGSNSQYRLEEYFNSRNILNTEYNDPNYRRKLSIMLANLHKIDIPNINKLPLIKTDLNDPAFFKPFEEKCADTKLYTPEEQLMIDDILSVTSEEEKSFLSKIIPNTEPVFCHNDLLTGNILIKKDSNEIVLIDYEYAAYNFRGFDLGNLFKEATFDFTHPEPPFFQIVYSYFPSIDELKESLQYYLVFSDMKEEDQKKHHDEFVDDKELLTEFIRKNYKHEEFTARVDELFRETKIGVMMAVYYWMIWGIKMCKFPDSDFDYVTFSHSNLEYYRKAKEELHSLKLI